jgi:hypothetical protein
MAEFLLYILFKTKFKALNTLLNDALWMKIRKQNLVASQLNLAEPCP